MTRNVPADLWKKLTSTVGLVCVRSGGATNVMAAEWSYFVNKQPLYAAVVLGPRATTRELIGAAGEFTVTFCSQEQAELADFAGSFSRADVDKTGSELIRLAEPEVNGSPRVTGGVAAVECELRQTVPFPVHTMYVGEVVAAHLPEHPRRPLVKHGPMHLLGDPVERTAVVASALLLPGRMLRVAATAPPGAGGRWRMSLLSDDGEETPLAVESHPTGSDFLADLPLPEHMPADGIGRYRLKAERDGAKAGFSSVTGTSR